MATRLLFLITLVCSAIMVLQVSALTNELDAQALRDIFRSLNNSVQLKNWKLDGGDPCGESWIGVQCYESSVINLELHGLALTGNLSLQLSNLKSLKLLDLSANSIEGSIPNSLPLNVTHLNLAENRLNQSIPYSIEEMKHLRHLNLSHNALSGPLANVFTGLENMRGMDLSFNSLVGDLPTSFRSLTNLTGLYLQSNNFTGSVVFLANLSLSNLNIEDNHFSGMIPEKFQSIHNLWIGGNRFDKVTNYPPWNFPLDTIPTLQDPKSSPATNLSAFESHPSQVVHKKKKPPMTGIVLVISGLALIAACATLVVVFLKRRSSRIILQSPGSSDESMRSPLPFSSIQSLYDSSMAGDSPNVSALSSSSMITPSGLPPIRTKTVITSRRNSSSKIKIEITAKLYTVTELQIATNNFCEENLLRDGSLGSVYRAEFPDGLILAVKNINTVPLSIFEEEQFLNVIRIASRLRHPNIVTLLGYCMEHGQHLIVYEFIRNLSLDDALYNSAYKPLPWSLRLQIALGIARGLNFMHSSSAPPITHSNLKAANILLDEDLMPLICDCGLSVLRPLTSNSLKLKASEMAIVDSCYIAPEHDRPGISNTKADVYAFGVLLLQLFSGRKPFDNSRPKHEQSLVNWASSMLHDSTSLEQMVDPAIARTISSKTLSHFADIVSLCIQPEQEFRPPMSEIVESLMNLMQKPDAIDGTESESYDRSFRSSNSAMFGSPSVSYYV